MTIVGTPGVQGYEIVENSTAAQNEKVDFGALTPLDDAFECQISSDPITRLVIFLSNELGVTWATWLAGANVGQTVADIGASEGWVGVPVKISHGSYRYLYIIRSTANPLGKVKMRIARANTVTNGITKVAV